MKKTFAIFLLVIFSSFLCTSFAEFNLDSLTKDQLLDLRSAVNKRLSELSEEKEQLLYTDKNMDITWIGLQNNDFLNNTIISLKITNKTKKPLYYEITNVAFNDIQVSFMNAFITEIGAGLTFLSATSNCTLINLSDYSIVGINELNDIHKVFFEFSLFKNESSYKPNKKLEFTVEYP